MQITNLLKSRIFLAFLAFTLALVIFSFATSKTGFTDTAEYINLAKEFAGINNSNLYVYHSVAYSMFLSLFLRIIPSLAMIKMINALWLLGILIVIYSLTKNKNTIWLWIFSPLAYYMSILISPILASSFFLILAYYFLKKYEASKKKRHFILSGLSLGIVVLFRTPEAFIAIIFVLIFFYEKQFKQAFYYSILVCLVFAIKLFIDYIIFGFPFYEVINYLSGQSLLYFPPRFLTMGWILSFFIISPFTLMIYKTKEKKELLFVIIAYGYFSMLAHYRLLLVIAPFIIIMLSKILSKKQIWINTVIAIIITLFLVNDYFHINDDKMILEDLKKIDGEFSSKNIITTDGDAYFFSALYWNDFNYIWLRDYRLKEENKSYYSEYSIISNPIIRDSKKVEYLARVKQIRDKNLDEVDEEQFLFVFKKEEVEYIGEQNKLIVTWFDEKIEIDDIEESKCYDRLCVYKKIRLR